MGRASEDFFVDIGLATARPASLGVMDLAAIAGHCATGEGAAAVARLQDDAWSASGEPFCAPEVERLVLVLIEDHKIVVRVARHPDDIRHRE